MAKLKVYSVYDSKVQAFAQPFFMRTRGEALRGWEEVSNDSSTSICRHPNDFCLMELAEYDESTGTFSNLASPLNLGLAVQFKRPPEIQTPLFDSFLGQGLAGPGKNNVSSVKKAGDL